MTARARLVCCYCQEPIRKSGPRGDNFDHRYDVDGTSQVERAWHRACEPGHTVPDTPWQAAVQQLKRAVAAAKRLPPAEELAFWEVYERVREQRDG